MTIIKTEIRPASDPQFDADTITLTLSNGSRILVYAFEGRDGVPFVQIDTDASHDDLSKQVGRFKIAVNDGTIWDADAELPVERDDENDDRALVNRDPIPPLSRALWLDYCTESADLAANEWSDDQTITVDQIVKDLRDTVKHA